MARLAFAPVLAAVAFGAAAQHGKPSTSAGSTECRHTSILKPSPFLGTANEIIVLADGSIWEDMSYKYLYLYVYQPQVLICPGLGKMVIEAGGTTHTFMVQRVR
jgi:hypothetical protein